MAKSWSVVRVIVPFWLLLLLAAIPTITFWRMDRHRYPSGRCRLCGYNLTGNVSGRCPECGAVTQYQVQ